MGKILTVTLNPAVDKTLFCSELRVGNVNRMRQVEKYAGGKCINVSRMLRQFDKQVVATGYLGGAQGEWIAEQIKETGIRDAFVRIEQETRCSTNIVADNGYVTEILEPGPMVNNEECRIFMDRYRELLEDCEIVVMSGSAPSGVPDVIYAGLIKEAASRGIPTVLDSSGEYLLKGIQAAPTCIKPNRKELEYVAGHKLKGMDDILQVAEHLLQEGIQVVAVSLGKEGILIVTEKERLLAKMPALKAINTVGCGDSVVTALTLGIVEGKETKEMLLDAISISAAASTTRESGIIPLREAEKMRNDAVITVL